MADQHKDNHPTIRSSAAEYLTYIAATGDNPQSIEMRYEDENIWLTQKLMAVLYDVDVRTINYHIKKILEDGELNENSVIRKYWITASDGKKYEVTFYYMPADDYESDTVKDIIYNYLYKLDLTPSTYIVKDGKAVDLEEGVIEYDDLVRWLQKHEFIY